MTDEQVFDRAAEMMAEQFATTAAPVEEKATPKRRNKQTLERILEVAMAKRADSFDHTHESSYYRGVVDALSHALGLRDVFTVVERQVVTYDLEIS